MVFDDFFVMTQFFDFTYSSHQQAKVLPFAKNRDAHVKTPLRGAPEGFLRTNMPFFFLRHMILKRDLPFDNFRYINIPIMNS